MAVSKTKTRADHVRSRARQFCILFVFFFRSLFQFHSPSCLGELLNCIFFNFICSSSRTWKKKGCYNVIVWRAAARRTRSNAMWFGDGRVFFLFSLNIFLFLFLKNVRSFDSIFRFIYFSESFVGFYFIKQNMNNGKKKEVSAAAARRRSVAIWGTTRYGDITFSIIDDYIVDHSIFFFVLVTLLFGFSLSPIGSLTRYIFCLRCAHLRFHSHRFSRHFIIAIVYRVSTFSNFYCYSSSFVRSCPMHLFDCIALRDGEWVCVCRVTFSNSQWIITVFFLCSFWSWLLVLSFHKHTQCIIRLFIDK